MRRQLRWLVDTVSIAGGVAGFWSAWVTVFAPSDLHYYPYKQIDYISPPDRCFGTSMEVIVAPVTFVNAGARGTVVESAHLEVIDTNNPSITRHFSPGGIGTWGLVNTCDYGPDLKNYSPIPVEGRSSAREIIVFFPDVEPKPRIVAPSGRYEFRFTFTERQTTSSPFQHNDKATVRKLEPMKLTIGDFEPDNRPHSLYPEDELPHAKPQAKD